MKIFEIIPQLSSGGAERFVVDLCNELSKEHEVMLIVLFPLNNTNFFLSQISDRVRVESMNKHSGFDFTLFNKLRKKIMSEKPNVVHTHLRGIVYILPISCMMTNSVTFIHTVHNDASKEAAELFSRITRKFLFKTKKVIPVTISKESRKSFLDYYHMDAPMIYNGRNIPGQVEISKTTRAEFTRYRLSDNTRILVNLSRHHPVKRQPMIARICKRLENEGYDFAMLFIGRENKRDFMDEIRHADCSRVYILGERQEPLEYLSLADAFCLLSSYEGMPISLIEALGVGAIPVCTPVGGIKDAIVSGSNGILSEDLSEEACYKAIKTFLDMSNDEIKLMQLAAKQSYSPFSMTKCAAEYERLFNTK